jgi:hypothetical protein
MEENMKKSSMTGFVLWMVVVLGFSACDASLDPSDTGDSAISKPRGELTITDISYGLSISYVQVYEQTYTPAYETLGNLSLIATAGGISRSSPTAYLYTGKDSPWDDTGTYGVFLVTNSGNIAGYWKAISFDKGRASAVFNTFSSIVIPPPEE